jgi:predicted aspartyl protease
MRLLKLSRHKLPVLLILGVIFLYSFNYYGYDLNNSKDSFISSTCFSFIPEDSKPTLPPETDMLTIPLKNAGRLFMIEAIIDNQSGNLIFDTGASGLVMNRTYFRKHLRLESQNSNGITGQLGEVDKISLDNINISGLTLKGMPASLADLGHVENRRGVKVLGLIGFEVFKEFEIVIDASNNELQLHRIDSKGNRVNNTLKYFKPDITQPVEVVRNILFLKGTVGGKLLRFCLDTGAETNVISSRASKSVLNTITLNRKSNLSGAGKKSVEVLFGSMNDFVLAGHQIKNMETIVTQLDALNEAYGVEIDGMLGYNFLTQGIISVNFTKRQLGMKFSKTE